MSKGKLAMEIIEESSIFCRRKQTLVPFLIQHIVRLDEEEENLLEDLGEFVLCLFEGETCEDREKKGCALYEKFERVGDKMLVTK